MPDKPAHIPYLDTISDFFRVYGLGKPLHPEIMCMRLEEQPDAKLVHMPLVRSNFFRVIHFTNSKLSFEATEKTFGITRNCICFTYPGKLESWTRTGKLYGYVIYFTAAFAGLDTTGKLFDKDYPYFNFNSEPMLPLTNEQAAEIIPYAEEMIKEIYSNNADKLDILKKLLHVYLFKIKRLYNNLIQTLPDTTKNSRSLYNRFRKELDDYMQELLAQRHSELPAVSLLAKRLSVNPNYLNSSIKELTGKPASAHIHEKLVLEAKSFLLHTELQVSSIAYNLGFENISYFNRFFKKNTNMPPQEFRKQFAKTH